MTSRLTRLAGASALLLTAASGAANALDLSLSGNVAITTDYILRGISQTEERPALQGGFDAATDIGLYAGIWGSNVTYDKITDGASNANLEMDYYAGYTNTAFCEDCAYKIGLIYYQYFGDHTIDYFEVAGSYAFKGFTVGFYYSPEYLGNATTNAVGGDEVDYWYPYVNYSYALPWWDLSLGLHVGYATMSEEGVFEPNDDNYTDWSAGLSKVIKDVTFAVTYYDTNMDQLYQDFGGNGSYSDAGARVVFSASKAL